MYLALEPWKGGLLRERRHIVDCVGVAIKRLIR